MASLEEEVMEAVGMFEQQQYNKAGFEDTGSYNRIGAQGARIRRL
jgi:hypothetical protein